MCEKDSDLALDFAFPSAHYPEWWNVHTHRCNHHGRLPSYQQNYGLGRAMFADWGRVGSVRIFANKSGVKVTHQISGRLNELFHGVSVPTPLFAANYLNMPSHNKEWCSAQPAATSDQVSGVVDNLTAYDFGFGHMLDDPIIGEQASAAFICGKAMGLMRANCGLLHEKQNKSLDVLGCLVELEELTAEGVNCRTAEKQYDIFKRIDEEITRIPADETDTNALHSSLPEEELTMNHVKAKRNRKSFSTKPVSPSLLPITLRRMINCNSANDMNRRLLAAFDPFIIRLAGRIVNPSYLGHGLLHTFREHLIWTLPEAPDGTSSSLWFSPSYHLHDSKPMPIELPHDIVAGTHCCELDVWGCDTQSEFSIVSRWNSYTDRTDNVVFLHFDLPTDAVLPQLKNFTKPSLPGLASSVCFNPWLSTECAITGSCSTNVGENLAFVRLQSTDVNRAAWSGHVKLDNETDGFNANHRQIMHAAGFFDTSDPVQSSLETYLGMLGPRVSRFHYRSPTSSLLTDYGLRVGFADHPSQLGLYTTNRILLLDTRQTTVCQTLFSLTSESPQTFNPAERFTYNSDKLIGDVYALASTQYSMLILDKRMPGCSVLHWSHNLLGPPVYANWLETSSRLQNSKDLPHILISMASHFPPDTSLVGLDVFSHSGPQLLGPSLLASRPTGMVHHDRYCLPAQLLRTGHRLQASLCGLVGLPPSDDSVSVLSLTSKGDIFKHSWAYSEAHATEQYEVHCERNGRWLSDLALSASEQVAPVEPTGHLDVTEACRLSATSFPSETSDMQQYWEPENIRPSDAFTGKVVHCSNQLLMDLQSIWMNVSSPVSRTKEMETRLHHLTVFREERAKEERLRRIELDALTIAAKARLKRLKSIVDHMLREYPLS